MKVLTQDQIQQVHRATLEVMEHTGVKIEGRKAKKMLKDAGCWIERENIVHFPSRLVDWALASVPKRLALSNRRGDRVMFLEGNRSYFGPGPTCSYFLDHRTGTRTTLKKADAVAGATAPVTLAGMLVTSNSEVLAGLVLAGPWRKDNKAGSE